jgi:hypothetical protein
VGVALGQHLRRDVVEDREGGARAEQARGRLHEDPGAAGPEQEQVGRAGLQSLGDHRAQTRRLGDGAGLDADETVLVEGEHGVSGVGRRRAGTCLMT